VIVKFWGSRGSIPVPGRDTVVYGGNTVCIEVRTPKAEMILDAGTGIRELGLALAAPGQPLNLHLLISHTHWDHIHGFPFFAPIYRPGNEIDVYGPIHHEKTFEEILAFQMDYSYFPVSAVQLAANIRYHDLKEETFKIEDAEVTARFLNHPVFMLGYRIVSEGKILVYTGDNEPYFDFLSSAVSDAIPSTNTEVIRRRDVVNQVDECNKRVIEFCKDADLLITDAQYTEEEYLSKRGWGHSSVKQALDLAIAANAKILVLCHHDPMRRDSELRQIEQRVRRDAKQKGLKSLKVFAAREKQEFHI
jgi:phosphoribosyl 1,2-cyclic phosphodiesterase